MVAVMLQRFAPRDAWQRFASAYGTGRRFGIALRVRIPIARRRSGRGLRRIHSSFRVDPEIEPVQVVLADRGPKRRRGEDLKQVQDYRSEEHTSELQSLRHLVCRL